MEFGKLKYADVITGQGSPYTGIVGNEREGVMGTDAIHLEAAAWALSQLDADDRHKFATELKEFGNKIANPNLAADEMNALARGFVDYVQSWVLTVKLNANPEWQRQVAQSDALWEKGIDKADLLESATLSSTLSA